MRIAMLIILLAVPWAMAEEKVAETRTFEEQTAKVTAYLKTNKLQLNKKLYPEPGTSAIATLMKTPNEKLTDFLEQAEEPAELPLAPPKGTYTAIILNPVSEEDHFLYPLLYADVSDLTDLKAVILFTHATGEIAYARIRHKLSPRFIVELIDDSFFPDEAVIKMEMHDKKSNGRTNSFKFTIHAVRNLGSVMEFTAPKREIGNKVLLKKDTLLMYSRRISKPMRLVNRDAFMGSSFSNNDLMDTSLADDYNITVEKAEAIDGVECIKLVLEKKHIRVTYPRMEIWLRTDNLIAMRMDYFTPSGKVLKRMETRKIKMMGGRERASELVMTNMFEKDSETVVVITDIQVRKIPRKVFTESYLKR
ncbi:outer membrane lipoprotein-sorting protein [Planctomycetota bacterium]